MGVQIVCPGWENRDFAWYGRFTHLAGGEFRMTFRLCHFRVISYAWAGVGACPPKNKSGEIARSRSGGGKNTAIGYGRAANSKSCVVQVGPPPPPAGRFSHVHACRSARRTRPRAEIRWLLPRRTTAGVERHVGAAERQQRSVGRVVAGIGFRRVGANGAAPLENWGCHAHQSTIHSVNLTDASENVLPRRERRPPQAAHAVQRASRRRQGEVPQRRPVAAELVRRAI